MKILVSKKNLDAWVCILVLLVRMFLALDNLFRLTLDNLCNLALDRSFRIALGSLFKLTWDSCSCST